ncbi:hypothetical protein GCM10025864_10280 [Luteimicrobium album]|uniref:DUF86 domain-containing protein n=1 Tax=Luteimicrobium album TaxID=1054550 RepID=A0ABQ6I0F3_9MICO|nr:HepT-like ribonuclease domain-containing protein [Luteimicrobium album]GMA23269.1 hypothetical protein GCM10025864_10280 [Luteimicrobium album]
MTDGADQHLRDEADYATDDEERTYREDRGYPKNARPFSSQQTVRRLSDLLDVADRCAQIARRGEPAFFADDIDGELLRAAAERYLISLGTVVEKLHSDYKDAVPDVPWRAVTAMRNLIAHHYDKVDDEVVWQSISRRVPELVDVLGLTGGVSDAVLPPHLRGQAPRSSDPFPDSTP